MNRKTVKKIYNFLLDCIFTTRCVFCGEVADLENGVCDLCAVHLPVIKEPVCMQCGLEKKVCVCKSSQMFYAELAVPFYYEDMVANGVRLFKFRRFLFSADYFAQMMSSCARERFSDCNFDIITGVPMWKKDQKRRGYNQSMLLAKKIAEIMQIPFEPNLLTKLYSTKKQHNLSSVSRKGNLIGAFDMCYPQQAMNKRILLVDDVSTTGGTMNECAKMLYLYGAKEICCLALAKTKPKRKEGEEHCSESISVLTSEPHPL